MQTTKTILFATDFSELAGNAFHVAFALARDHRACLILLYVREPQETVQGEFRLMPPEPEPSDADILDRLSQPLPEDSPVQVERLVVQGMTAETIIQVATEKHCDLIVMGTHGRKGFGRLFHANLADHVTRLAPCPVLAFRSSQTEAEPNIVDAIQVLDRVKAPIAPQATMLAENEHDLVRLTGAANPVLAHILQQALEEDGIHCQVLGDYLEAGIGNIAGFSAEVWVETADLPRAAAILRAHQDRPDDATQPVESVQNLDEI